MSKPPVLIAALCGMLIMLLATPGAAQAAPGSVLAPVGRQVGWLDLDAPRPRILASFEKPAFVTDVGR